MEEIEIWKDILEYEGLYQVSNFGKVKSLPRNTTKGGILKLTKDNNGYLNVILCKNGKIKRFRVHRLVALAFIPNIQNLPIINHKNEIKTDNRVENLEFCTAKHNSNYGTRNERLSKINKGKISPNKKPIIQCTLNGEFIRDWDSATTASRELKLSQGHITLCCQNRKKSAGGFVWRYM